MENNIDITLLVINIVSILYLSWYKYIKNTNPNLFFFQGLLAVVFIFILYFLFLAVVIEPGDAMYLVVVLVYQIVYFPFVALIMFLISLTNNKTWILIKKKKVCRYVLLLLILMILDIYWIFVA